MPSPRQRPIPPSYPPPTLHFHTHTPPHVPHPAPTPPRVQRRASERVTVPPDLRSEVRFSPMGEQLGASARARGTVTSNTVSSFTPSAADAPAARRERSISSDALPPLPEVLDAPRAAGSPTAEERGAAVPSRDLARSSAAATGRSTAAAELVAELASQSVLPPPTPPRVIHASFDRVSAERGGGEHRRGGTGRSASHTCELLPATCYPPPATCYLLLAPCYLLLTGAARVASPRCARVRSGGAAGPRREAEARPSPTPPPSSAWRA